MATRPQDILRRLEDGKNFHNWRFRIELLMEEKGLGDVLANKLLNEDNKKRDAEARSLIVQNIGDSFIEIVKGCKTSKDMMDSLEKFFARKSVMNKLHLKKKLIDLKCDGNEKLQDFFLRFDRLITDNESMTKIDEADKVVHLLLALPEKFRNVTTALEAMNDSLTLEKIKATLLDAEIRMEDVDSISPNQDNAFHIECWNCHQKGHKAMYCRKAFKHGLVQQNSQRGFPVRRGYNRHTHKGMHSQGGVFKASTSRDSAHIGDNEICNEMGCMIDGEFNLTCKAINNEVVSFVIDSGASQNFISDNYESYMTNIKQLEHPITINMANGEKVMSYYCGNLPIKCDSVTITIEGFIVANLAYNLLSVRKLLEKPNEIIFKRDYAQIHFFNGSTVWAYTNGKLYILQGKITAENGAAAIQSVNGLLWHRRLGHTSSKNLSRLGLPINNNICDPCMKGKASRLPFKRLEKPRSHQVLEFIHSDIAGPSNVPTIQGEIYFQTIIDDYSHFCVVFLLKRKAEAAENFINYINRYENEFEKTVKRIRCDNAGENTCDRLRQFCKNKGIVLEYSLPYSPASNGVAERMNRSLYNKARTMLIETNLPKNLWGEAIKCAAYQINRCTSVAINYKTPCEILYGTKDLNKLRVFGAKAWACILPKPDKFSERAREARMVGYSRTGYNLWDPKANKLFVSRDVRFDENNLVYNEDNLTNEIQWEGVSEAYQQNNEPVADLEHNEQNRGIVVDTTNVDEQFVESEEVFEDCVEEVEIERVNNINGSGNVIKTRSGRIVKPPKRLEDYETHVAYCLCTGDPNSYKEAMQKGQGWQEAIDKELNSLKSLGTWEESVLPEDKRAIDTKWVFTTKKDGTKKARLVAKGFQEETLFNVYSPVARMPTIRMMLSQAVQNNMYMKQLDVPTAFLNGFLKEEVYIKPPLGVKVQNGIVLKLNRSLYGLKQAPKCWNERLHSFLIDNGFVQSKYDFCLYISSDVFLLIYVDDMILMSKSEINLNKAHEILKIEFNVKDLGEVNTYLGLCIVRTTETISINQESAIDRILEKFNMTDCKGVETPMETNFDKDSTENEVITLDMPYRELVGCLLYLSTSSRPDICFAVSVLSRFLDRPTISLWKAAKRVLRYLKQTKSKSLIYKRDSSRCCLIGYSDADWAGDRTDRKSVSGSAIYHGDNLLAWFCKKQNVVALSTAEAEYIAAALASAELVYLKGLLQNFNCPPDAVLYVDNQSAIKLIESNENSKRSKHIDIKYHYIKDLISKQEIIVKYVSTNENVADVFTKALSKQKHNYFVKRMGFN